MKHYNIHKFCSCLEYEHACLMFTSNLVLIQVNIVVNGKNKCHDLELGLTIPNEEISQLVSDFHYFVKLLCIQKDKQTYSLT